MTYIIVEPCIDIKDKSCVGSAVPLGQKAADWQEFAPRCGHRSGFEGASSGLGW